MDKQKLKDTSRVVRKKIDGVIEQLPKNDWKIAPSAKKAGYPDNYANKQTSTIKNAVFNRVRELSKVMGENRGDGIFLNLQECIEEYNTIIKQNKDLSTKERATRTLLKLHGVPIDEQEQHAKTAIQIVFIDKPSAEKAQQLTSQNVSFANIDEKTGRGEGEAPNA